MNPRETVKGVEVGVGKRFGCVAYERIQTD